MDTINLVGRRIVGVRRQTERERTEEGWYEPALLVLELDDGSILYPARDPEGNGPGALFYAETKGPNAGPGSPLSIREIGDAAQYPCAHCWARAERAKHGTAERNRKIPNGAAYRDGEPLCLPCLEEADSDPAGSGASERS